jgi:hypothetical protein
VATRPSWWRRGRRSGDAVDVVASRSSGWDASRGAMARDTRVVVIAKNHASGMKLPLCPAVNGLKVRA